MKPLLLSYFLFIVLSLSSKGQDMVVNLDELRFDSSMEKELWESGTGNSYLLFRAVHAEKTISDEKWDVLLAGLDSRYAKKGTHVKVLRQIFEKSHQQLFKTYEQHSTFNDMLAQGKYDCVSASAALALLLDRYGFEYKVVETDYHVFVVVNHEEKNIILESTLPVGGMITSPTEVAAYLESYKADDSVKLKSLNQRLGAPKIDLTDNAIFRKVNLTELAGLQYYNDAISHFNEQNFDKASSQLSKALKLYNSERIEGLKELADQQGKLISSSH